MAGFRFVIPVSTFSLGYPSSPIEVVPDKNFGKTVAPRTLSAKFGDGYRQDVADGINVLEETFNATFNTRPKEEVDNIVAFFDSNYGVKSFDLILSDNTDGVLAPFEKTVKVICINWSQYYMYDNFYGCTAVFERTYAPVSWSAA